MKIQDHERYHGPALMRIVEHPSFKALNKATAKYGHYQVNKDIKIWTKYSSHKGSSWQFTFGTDDLLGIMRDYTSGNQLFMVMACADRTICCVTYEQFSELVDPDASATQWIRVRAPKGKSMRVTGSAWEGDPMIVAHNCFPGVVFER